MDRRAHRLLRRGGPLVLVVIGVVVLAGPQFVHDNGVAGPIAGLSGSPRVPAALLATVVPALTPGLVTLAPTDGATVPPTISPTILPTPAPTTLATPKPKPGSTILPTTRPAATTAPTTAPTKAPTAAPIPPLSSCAVFPATNVWNRRVDGLPVAGDSASMISAIGLGSGLHPDFSNAGGYGIPFNVVGTSTARSNVVFDYAAESDSGPYPIPASPKIEGGSDRHILMIDTNACRLFELYAAAKGGSGWTAGSGAIWSLTSNALRPVGWTSADAAGLPIFPGLVRYSEVAAGVIPHAIRFTAPATCSGYAYPARHQAGSGSCASKPPMGLRVRLKASVDVSGYGPQARVVLRALQQFGMLLADNGSPWYITGAPDGRWNDDDLHALGGITGGDFEVVDTTGLVNG